MCDKIDNLYGGRLHVHMGLLLDKYTNLGLTSRLIKLIKTIQAREILTSIIL